MARRQESRQLRHGVRAGADGPASIKVRLPTFTCMLAQFRMVAVMDVEDDQRMRLADS